MAFACLSVLTASAVAQHFVLPGAAELSEKPTILLAQAPPPSTETDQSQSDEQPETDSESGSEFVFAGDLAITLRKIDPDAKVDWDGKKLIINVNDQDFAIFPTGEDMVVNGDVESGLPPLKIRNGEIYVPQEAVGRIGTELESVMAPPTTTVTPTPAAEETTVTATPATSILPDVTPAATTSSPTTASSPVLPDITPEVTPDPTPPPTPGPNQPSAVATPAATPFPQATPTPTPKPTPTPTPTPTPRPTAKSGSADSEQRNSTLSTASFKAALQDKISITTRDIGVFNSTQLTELSEVRNISKVLIHPDEGGYEREDDYGRRAAQLALAVSRRVKQQLESAGIEAELTRNTEEPMTAGETMQVITHSDAQVLLVLSVSYSTSFQDLGGYRIFYMNETVDYNTLRDRSFDATEAVPTQLNYKNFQTMSKVLSSSIKNSIHAALDRDPVGTNPAPQYYLRRAPMASTAVVVGYLSNPADAKRLTDESQQDEMANALAEGIRNYAEQLSEGKADAQNAGGL